MFCPNCGYFRSRGICVLPKLRHQTRDDTGADEIA